MASEFLYRRRVEFADTDMAGIVHFSRYFLYMEAAEHAFFRSLGFSIAERDSGVGWPRVSVSCEYHAPLRFEDEIEVHLKVTEKRARSLRYAFRLTRVGPGPAVEVATGGFVVVCVALDKSAGRMKAAPLPEALAAKIEAAP
jgi:YbgC/YbaW family acyl-CoA thioester hydrolase